MTNGETLEEAADALDTTSEKLTRALNGFPGGELSAAAVNYLSWATETCRALWEGAGDSSTRWERFRAWWAGLQSDAKKLEIHSYALAHLLTNGTWVAYSCNVKTLAVKTGTLPELWSEVCLLTERREAISLWQTRDFFKDDSQAKNEEKPPADDETREKTTDDFELLEEQAAALSLRTEILFWLLKTNRGCRNLGDRDFFRLCEATQTPPRLWRYSDEPQAAEVLEHRRKSVAAWWKHRQAMQAAWDNKDWSEFEGGNDEHNSGRA